MTKDQKRLLILSSLGGILEFYDFIIFALFAGYIANSFFPQFEGIGKLIITFTTFSIGYLVRPLGGVIFGHFGDRFGRKTTFASSILIMASATIGIGLMPGYNTIGSTAPFLVLALRILQGISIGGEIPGAITYVSESFPQQKGLACGIIFATLLLGIVLGSASYAVICSVLSPLQIYYFGWRIPFIFGGIFGILSYLFRKNLHESPQFLTIENSIETFPIITVLKQELSSTLLGSTMVALCAVTVTALFLFIPAYFTEILHLPTNAYVWNRTLAIAIGANLSIFFGYITDQVNPKKLLLLLCLLTLVFAYPIFFIYVYCPKFYYLSFMMSALLLGFTTGIIPRMLSELFSTKIRYTGIAISYNIGFAVFGGITPLLSLSLIYYTGIFTTPALCLIIASLIVLFSFFLSSQFNDIFVTFKNYRRNFKKELQS